MSLENHPNFHAVKFVTEVIKAFYDCRSGKATKLQIDDTIQLTIIEFVNEIEDHVDRRAEEDK